MNKRKVFASIAMLVIVVAMSFVAFATPSVVRLPNVVGLTTLDATTDGLNASLALIPSLLTALIPVILILYVMQMMFGLLGGMMGGMMGGGGGYRDRGPSHRDREMR